jgi:hypothetical protein
MTEDDRVRSRAEASLPEEDEVDEENRGAQAEAILADSDARSDDPATVEHDRDHVERRTSEETVDSGE